ncbi:hypothetical protein MTR67_050082 [Solanum verrucosum]|uniref:Uncharacterized protein n=1 Tax=Solanum verrucosum TaxID=315347 RepID=A0AAF0V264_SOLVR|nr:hypothetical protein MTR67_050082 [Solanum verrucosum]
MSAIVEPISPSKALIMDTMMDENNQQENMKMQDDESLREEQLLESDYSTSDEVDKSQVMLGTFEPRKEPYVYELEEDVTPSGVFARGLYTTRTQVIDEKERCYVDITYYFDIQRQWPESP